MEIIYELGRSEPAKNVHIRLPTAIKQNPLNYSSNWLLDRYDIVTQSFSFTVDRYQAVQLCEES